MGYPTSCTVVPPVGVKRGDRTACDVLSCPIAAVGGGIFREMRSPGL
jgi:hypothetical protein